MPKTVAAVASPRCAALLWVSSRCSSPPSSRQWRPPPRRPRRDRAGMSPRRDTPWVYGSCPSSTRRDRPRPIRTRRYPPPARRRARCRPPSTTRRRVRPRSRHPTAPTSRKPTRPLRRPATSRSSSSATVRRGRPTTTRATLERWAAEGYAVVAPTYPATSRAGITEATVRDQRDQVRDARFVLDHVLALDSTPVTEGGLGGLLDRRRIAAAGHSMGGLTSLALVSRCCRDRRVKAAVVLAGVSENQHGPRIRRPTGPIFFAHATYDIAVPFDRAGPPTQTPPPPSTSSRCASRSGASLRTCCRSSPATEPRGSTSAGSSTSSWPPTCEAIVRPAAAS